MKNLNSLFRVSLGWATLSRVIIQGISLIFTLILVRLIDPSVFGLFALLLLVTGVTPVIIKFGLGPSLIYNDKLNKDDYSSIFWFNIIACLLVLLLLFSVSRPISTFLNSPSLWKYIILLGSTYLFIAIKNVPEALLYKNLNYKRILIVDLFSIIIPGLLAIYLAYLDYYLIALITNIGLKNILAGIGFFIVSKWKPTFYLNILSIKKVFNLSVSLYFVSIYTYFANNLDKLILGKFVDNKTLGMYNKTYSLLSLISSNVSLIINNSILPIFAKKKDLISELKVLYISLLKILWMSLSFLLIPIGVFSESFVYLILGENWIDATDFVQLFSFTVIFTSINTITNPILASQGKSSLIFIDGIAKKTLLIIGLLIGYYFYGVIGVVVGKLIMEIINNLISTYLLSRVFKTTLFKIFYEIRNILISTLISTVALYLLKGYIIFESNLLNLLISYVFYCLSFIAIILLLKDKLFAELKIVLSKEQ